MFGKVAVDLIAQNQYDQMLAWQNGKVVTFPIQAVIDNNPSLVNPHGDLVQTARSLGIYIGE
jgi:6-phosphofructokinase 1